MPVACENDGEEASKALSPKSGWKVSKHFWIALTVKVALQN
jgi:hypothetical protein